MNIQRLKETLERHEGLRLKPYKDSVGKLSIGIGRNLDDNGIAEEEARYLLHHDLVDAIGDCRTHLPWFDELNDIRKEVMVNMMFNLGWRRLSTFRKMFRAISEQEFEWAAQECLDSKWATQVGDRAIELSEALRTGEFA